MHNLVTRRDALLKRLVAGGNFVKGSITSVCSTCARAHCICTTPPRGQGHPADRQRRPT